MQTSFYIRQTVKCGSRRRASFPYIKLFNEDGKRSRLVCYLKCFISMSKSVAFLFLPSRFPTMYGHQGFVYRKETRGLMQCYQFVCSNLHTVRTAIKFRPARLSYPVSPNRYAIGRMTYKSFSSRVGNAKKNIGFSASKFVNRSAQVMLEPSKHKVKTRSC
jgi:hypothetical protein